MGGSLNEQVSDWLPRACGAAEISATSPLIDDETIAVVLDLARDAAHNITRPAAPVATFVLGLAAAADMSIEELRQIAERISAATTEVEPAR